VRPRLRLLDDALITRALEEALQLLAQPGVRVGTAAARELLSAAGARVEGEVAHIPERMVRDALATAPREFALYTRAGEAAVRYGGDQAQFDPGSSCLNILDPETRAARPAESADLVRLVQVAEALPQFAAQATALVCNDVPSALGDFYRLFLVLLHSNKPVVTGAFSVAGLRPMLELLAADSGSHDALRRRPRAVFDVCPSPPLYWSEFAAENLVELARAGVPAEMVAMPLAGATAPVTLIGSVVQHAAECLSGITIHQLAQPGAPIVWGGAPAIFDMRNGTAPMGAVETAMLNLACCEVGKSLGLPTHGYLVASDSRSVDAQAGMESATSAALGALGGINMISGAGMLDFLACFSIEKLVLDAEAIASAQRLAAGIEVRGETLAVETFRQTGLLGNFLALPETRARFRGEQHFPSAVIERGGDPGAGDACSRARARVEELIASYEPPALASAVESGLMRVAEREAERAGLTTFPGVLQARE
jgi:trimethylamine--corrinoid protein Co-methyltransferase